MDHRRVPRRRPRGAEALQWKPLHAVSRISMSRGGMVPALDRPRSSGCTPTTMSYQRHRPLRARYVRGARVWILPPWRDHRCLLPPSNSRHMSTRMARSRRAAWARIVGASSAGPARGALTAVGAGLLDAAPVTIA